MTELQTALQCLIQLLLLRFLPLHLLLLRLDVVWRSAKNILVHYRHQLLWSVLLLLLLLHKSNFSPDVMYMINQISILAIQKSEILIGPLYLLNTSVSHTVAHVTLLP